MFLHWTGHEMHTRALRLPRSNGTSTCNIRTLRFESVELATPSPSNSSRYLPATEPTLFRARAGPRDELAFPALRFSPTVFCMSQPELRILQSGVAPDKGVLYGCESPRAFHFKIRK